MDLKKVIRTIENYPIEGVMFRDITTVLKDKEALKYSVDEMMKTISDLEFDYILGPESRGFIFAMPIAYNMSKGFIPVRKAGKLPAETIGKEYELEYGTATLEIHKDALKKGDKVIIIDDLLATGGTCKAMIELVESIGAEVVGLSFFIELEELKGRELLNGYNIQSIVKY
ncbi:MAG: adenine phosphoribosyltransferase [Eubacteriales bacterium]|nr:adenine phosphoribosyltransferase [Eubacteriales bacterium]